MAGIPETQYPHDGGTAFDHTAALTLEAVMETPPCACRWPTLGIAHLATREVDAALVADPLFHVCPDGQRGRVEVRYWYFQPLNFSCWHCSEGGGVCVVEPETVVCRHRAAHEPAMRMAPAA
jgi:hypothetical protein